MPKSLPGYTPAVQTPSDGLAVRKDLKQRDGQTHWAPQKTKFNGFKGSAGKAVAGDTHTNGAAF